MSEKKFPLIFDGVETLNKCWNDARLLTKHILTEKLSVASSEFNIGSKISTDLGGDSLDLVEIAIALEKITGVRVNEHLSFNYVLELIDYIYIVRIGER
jgi:acyl carrier protein